VPPGPAHPYCLLSVVLIRHSAAPAIPVAKEKTLRLSDASSKLRAPRGAGAGAGRGRVARARPETALENESVGRGHGGGVGEGAGQPLIEGRHSTLQGQGLHTLTWSMTSHPALG